MMSRVYTKKRLADESVYFVLGNAGMLAGYLIYQRYPDVELFRTGGLIVAAVSAMVAFAFGVSLLHFVLHKFTPSVVNTSAHSEGDKLSARGVELFDPNKAVTGRTMPAQKIGVYKCPKCECPVRIDETYGNYSKFKYSCNRCGSTLVEVKETDGFEIDD